MFVTISLWSSNARFPVLFGHHSTWGGLWAESLCKQTATPPSSDSSAALLRVCVRHALASSVKMLWWQSREQNTLARTHTQKICLLQVAGAGTAAHPHDDALPSTVQPSAATAADNKAPRAQNRVRARNAKMRAPRATFGKFAKRVVLMKCARVRGRTPPHNT